MSGIHGKNSVVFVKEYKLSGDANRLNYAYNVDTAEVTGFEAKGKEFVEGLFGWTMGMDGYWNSADNQADPVIAQLVGGGTHTVGIYPQGTTPGNVGYDGKGIVTSYAPEVAVAGAVVFSMDMSGDSKLYRQSVIHAGVTIGTDGNDWRNLGTLNPGGVVSVAIRTLAPSNGTTGYLKIQAATTDAGASSGDVAVLANHIDTGVQLTTIGTAINVGPYWRALWSIPAENSFNFAISVGINQ